MNELLQGLSELIDVPANELERMFPDYGELNSVKITHIKRRDAREIIRNGGQGN